MSGQRTVCTLLTADADEAAAALVCQPSHLLLPQVCQLIAAVNKAFLMHGLQTYYKVRLLR